MQQKFPKQDPIPAVKLYENDTSIFNFYLFLENKTFDNFDNPYGKFVLHRYSNMRDINETVNEAREYSQELTYIIDKEIELEESQEYFHNNLANGIKYYKPKFTEEDYLYGGYLTDKFSWIRLILHECDNSSEAQN